MKGNEKRGGISPMAQVMSSYLRESGLGSRLRRHEVFRAWRDALGEDLAQRADPVRFRDGELTVQVQSAAHLQELQNFTGEGFRRQANDCLGGERIHRVVFRLKQ